MKNVTEGVGKGDKYKILQNETNWMNDMEIKRVNENLKRKS